MSVAPWSHHDQRLNRLAPSRVNVQSLFELFYVYVVLSSLQAIERFPQGTYRHVQPILRILYLVR